MVAPGTKRPGKYMDGVIQVHVTRACDKACFNCTQASHVSGKPRFVSLGVFEACLRSLEGYWGVVGMFGGNPALHPQFHRLCELLEKYVPRMRRGIWCNNPLNAENASLMRQVFNPGVSNINVHMDERAAELFVRYWPEVHVVGLREDSRHAPPWVAMKDVEPDESKRWDLISRCDINKHWSAMCGEFRGQPRAWFCEIAGAQAIRYQDNPSYPDTGYDPSVRYTSRDGTLQNVEWWQLSMRDFERQVRKHCHECGVPLRGRGELAVGGEAEQVSGTHAVDFVPKREGRRVELVQAREQLGERTGRFTDYLERKR